MRSQCIKFRWAISTVKYPDLDLLRICMLSKAWALDAATVHAWNYHERFEIFLNYKFRPNHEDRQFIPCRAPFLLQYISTYFPSMLTPVLWTSHIVKFQPQYNQDINTSFAFSECRNHAYHSLRRYSDTTLSYFISFPEIPFASV